MRTAEVILAGFFATFVVVALVSRIEAARRWSAVGFGVAGLLILAALPFLETLPGGRVGRDLIPGLLLLFTYWQTGHLVVVRDRRFQDLLARFDRRWFPRTLSLSGRIGDRAILSRYLHASYLACYPMVPLGVGVLYMTGHADAVSSFWLVVLPPTLACQAITIVLSSWPPWMEAEVSSGAERGSSLESVNRWLTDNASIRANTFPSGHAASTTATALALLGPAPVWGGVFLWLAGSVAVATVLLRYHYTLDTFLGLGLAVAAWVSLG